MRKFNSIKNEKIGHLQWCLDKLRLKENFHNCELCENLYRSIMEIVIKMSTLDDEEALVYYRKEMESRKIKELLKYYNIELMV